MTGDCEYCGREGVEVIRDGGYLLCADEQACQAEYDRITEDEGWLW